MALFGEVLGIGHEEELVDKTLAAEKVDRMPEGKSITVASTEETTQRGERGQSLLKELDLTYRKEPQVFGSINLKTQIIMSAGYELRTDNDPGKRVLNFFKEFLDNIGNVGEEYTEEEILKSIFKNQMEFGRDMVETVYNPKKTHIVDLALTDPITMDFARDQKGSIVFNPEGNPVGYTQKLGNGVDTSGKGDPVPDSVSLETGEIFILPERIAYFWLYGDKLNPIGLIEPGYRSVIRKQNIQEAQTNSIYARGTYPIIDYVGSPERFPTPKMIANATNKLKMMQHNRYFAFPYWHRIEPVEVKQSDIVEKTIEDLREEISASLGMPLAFSMGSGEATNRATLNNQQKMLEFSLNDVVKQTLAAFRRQIFRRISEIEKFKDSKGKLIVPYYVWGDVGAEDKDAKASRLANYLKNGGITSEYVIPYVVKSEKLMLDPKIILPPKDDKKEKENKKANKELSKARKTDFTYQDITEIIKELGFQKESEDKNISKKLGFSYSEVNEILEGGLKHGNI